MSMSRKPQSKDEALEALERRRSARCRSSVDSRPRASIRHRWLAPDRAAFVVDQVCGSLAEAHRLGLVHRDLKPGNIFCDEGVVKLGDYGLSKFISCSRRSGHTESIGTVHYMAPEVANGRYGKEIDVYALGIILYEMLTGQRPYGGDTVQEILAQHYAAPIPRLPGRRRPSNKPTGLPQTRLRPCASSACQKLLCAGFLKRN